MGILEQAVRIRAAMDRAGGVLDDQEAASALELFSPWRAGQSGEPAEYTAGERRRYEGSLYRCLVTHSHNGEADWTPDRAPSLWVGIDDPAVEWPDWRQPLGGPDAYPLGAKVTHLGQRWRSLTEANVWEPGVSGWEKV